MGLLPEKKHVNHTIHFKGLILVESINLIGFKKKMDMLIREILILNLSMSCENVANGIGIKKSCWYSSWCFVE